MTKALYFLLSFLRQRERDWDRLRLPVSNDLTNLYKHFILSEGGFNNYDLNRIISKINRTPQRNLGWSNSVEIARELLQGNIKYATWQSQSSAIQWKWKKGTMLKALLIAYLIFRFLVRSLFMMMKGLLIFFSISWFIIFLLVFLFYFRVYRQKWFKQRKRLIGCPGSGEKDRFFFWADWIQWRWA